MNLRKQTGCTDATKLNDVYNFNDLIDLDIFESLNDEALKILGTNSLDLP